MILYNELDSQGKIVRSQFILAPGMELPEGHTWEVYVPSIDDIKDKKKQQIDYWRNAACIDDVIVPVGGTTYTWQADKNTQVLLSSLITLIAAGVQAVPAVWRTADNQNVPVTVTDLHNLSAAMANQTQLAYYHSWEVKAAIDAATTEDQVNAITW